MAVEVPSLHEGRRARRHGRPPSRGGVEDAVVLHEEAIAVVYDLGQAAAAHEVRRGAGAEEIRQQKLAVFVEEAGERPWE